MYLRGITHLDQLAGVMHYYDEYAFWDATGFGNRPLSLGPAELV
jgi:hypothetical protein